MQPLICTLVFLPPSPLSSSSFACFALSSEALLPEKERRETGKEMQTRCVGGRQQNTHNKLWQLIFSLFLSYSFLRSLSLSRSCTFGGGWGSRVDSLACEACAQIKKLSREREKLKTLWQQGGRRGGEGSSERDSHDFPSLA